MQRQQEWALLEISGGQHKVTCTFLSSTFQDTKMMALALLSTSPGQRYHKQTLQEFPEETCTPAPTHSSPELSTNVGSSCPDSANPDLLNSEAACIERHRETEVENLPGEGVGTNVLHSHQHDDLGEHPWEQASWEPRGKEGCPDNSSLSMQWAIRQKGA